MTVALPTNFYGHRTDDVFAGTSGFDNFYGGNGNDTYHITSGDTITEMVYTYFVPPGDSLAFNPTVDTTAVYTPMPPMPDMLMGYNIESSYDLIAAGLSAALNSSGPSGGIDTVYADFDYTLGTSLENLILTGSATHGTGNGLANTMTANSGQGSQLDGLGGNDRLNGNGLGDTLNGGDGDDILLGRAGDDALDGGAGNDTMFGGAGNDTLTGGDGNDVYYIGAGDVVNEAGLGGIDTVHTSANLTLDPASEIENVTLTLTAGFAVGSYAPNVMTGNGLDNFLGGRLGDDTIYGGGGSDQLNGGEGNDVLNGQTGADRMIGGTGNDTYRVDNVGDIVDEDINSGTGIDTVYASVNYLLTGFAENLVLMGGAQIGTGSLESNTLTGNALDNQLFGRRGDDTLWGRAGNDSLSGDDANETVSGDDTLDGGSGNDTLSGGIGVDLLTGGSGHDLFVFASTDAAANLPVGSSERITDFNQSQHDRINLMSNVAGETFIGTAAFSNTGVAEIRFETVGGQTVVQGDADGNGTADILVVLDGILVLTPADFVL